MRIFDRTVNVKREFSNEGEFTVFVKEVFRMFNGVHNVQIQKGDCSKNFNVGDKKSYLRLWGMQIK